MELRASEDNIVNYLGFLEQIYKIAVFITVLEFPSIVENNPEFKEDLINNGILENP